LARMAMFGLIVSGRLVSTSWEQAGPTNVVAEIQDADSVNHVVIFLTGAVPFPEGMGGSVYFCWPQPDGVGQVWQLLGVISNTKPSAIFRIGRLKKNAGDENITNSFMELGQVPRHNAMVGISVEPLVVIEGLTPAAQTEASNVSSFMEFSQKTLESLFNYCSSFAMAPADTHSRPTEQFVPLSVLQQWYSNFERRLQQNPYFWRK